LAVGTVAGSTPTTVLVKARDLGPLLSTAKLTSPLVAR
jgi:hypothetical protein